MKDLIGERMKAYYEEPAKSKLTKQMPVIVRVYDRDFNTLTKGLIKPFDMFITKAMKSTASYLLTNIQDAKFVYTQGNEISLLINYDNPNQSEFSDDDVQKLTSEIESMATLHFNKTFKQSVEHLKLHMFPGEMSASERRYVNTLDSCAVDGTTFDARCFNIPESEVVNYFSWRQNDAFINAVSSIGRSNFSQKMLQKKSNEDIIKMLAEHKGINNLTDVYPESCIYGYNQYKKVDENDKSVYPSFATVNFNDIRNEMETILLPNILTEKDDEKEM